MPQGSSLNNLLAILYAAPLKPELWSTFLNELSCATGYRKGTIIAHNAVSNSHDIMAACGEFVEDTANIAEYEHHYCRYDLWSQTLSRRRSGRGIVLGEEIWPEDQFRKSLFFNEFLAKVDIRQGAFFVTPGGSKHFESLSLYRGPSEAAFSSDGLGLLVALELHLQTAFAIRRRLAGLEAAVEDFETSFDKLNSAIVLLDAQRRPVFVSSAAQRLFREQNGCRRSSSGISAASPVENDRLQEAISKAVISGIGRVYWPGIAVRISRSDGNPLCVFAAPLVAEPGNLHRRAVAILFIKDPDSRRTISSEVLRELYGMTRAECRLALLLQQGNSLSEAAAIVGVSGHTVRSQMKSVFQKTGTRRQSQLMGLLANLHFDGDLHEGT